MTTAKSNKDLLAEVCRYIDENGGKDMAVIIAIADETGTASTIRPSNVVEEAEPGHMETALLILCGTYYRRFLMPETNPSEWKLGQKLQ